MNISQLVALHPLPWSKSKDTPGGWWQVLDSTGAVVFSAIAQISGSVESTQLADMVIDAANHSAAPGHWVAYRPIDEDTPIDRRLWFYWSSYREWRVGMWMPLSQRWGILGVGPVDDVTHWSEGLPDVAL